MDAETKDINSRKSEIETELEMLFKSNMKITDWNVPETKDKEVAELILDVLQKKIDTIRADVQAGKYNNY